MALAICSRPNNRWPALSRVTADRVVSPDSKLQHAKLARIVQVTMSSVLSKDMHQRLVEILDDPVIVAVDMQADVGELSRWRAGKAGHRDGADTRAFRQFERAHNICRASG